MASDNEASCASDPNFAVICSFLECFGKSCGIIYPDIARLQEMLENTQEVPQQLIDLHIKLLRKTRKTVSPEKWERALVKFCHTYSNQDGWELERFGYKKARLAVKLRLLKVLLETQFDLNQKFKNEVNKVAANELRVEPLGRDKTGLAYWCQLDEECNIRVYREDIDEENWELVAKDRDGVVNLINALTNGEIGPIPINEDSNSLEVSEKPIIDTGQISTSPSLQDEAVQENGVHADGLDEKELEKSGEEYEDTRGEDDINNVEEDMDGEDEITNDETSKENTEDDDSQQAIQNEVSESNPSETSLSAPTTPLKIFNGKVGTLSERESIPPQEKELSSTQETVISTVVSDAKPMETYKPGEYTTVSSSKVDFEESMPLKSIETPVITSPLKLVNIPEVKQVQEEKMITPIAPIAALLNVTKMQEDLAEQVMKPLDKLSNKGNNFPFVSMDMSTAHSKLSVKPIDQLAANLVRIQSEKLEKPSGAKSLEKIAENLARTGSIVGNVVNGDDDRLPQDFCARNQIEKANPLREHRGMDLSTSPRGWESANEQNRPMDFSGIDLSSRKFNKTIDLPSPGYRTQDFQHREMDLSTKKLNKPEVATLPYDARAVMMRSHAMVADLSKRQMSFPSYDMPSAPYHNAARIPNKEDHRLPNYTILPDPSKITALRMNATPVKRTLDADEIQQDMLKRIRADVIPIRGSMDKRPVMNSNWGDEVSEAIEEPMMMIQGEGSGSDCDAINPDLGETVEEPIIFFYGEGSGEECQTGNPGEDTTTADNKESNESKNEADSAAPSLSPNKNINDDSLINEVSAGSPVTNKSTIKLNRNFPQSSVSVRTNCQSVGSTQEQSKFKPTLGIQIIPKNSSSPVKRISRWDVGKPEEKPECDSSIISNEENISQKKNDTKREDSSSGKENVQIDRNSVTVEDTALQETNTEQEENSRNAIEEKHCTEQRQSLVLDDSVQCDSSVSLCPADTSETLRSCTEVTAANSVNNTDTAENFCDTDSVALQETNTSKNDDNECKSAGASPPRFFFGPNCISYTSKTEMTESQSDQTVSTTIESKSDTLQYECVSSSKPTEDTTTSNKSDDFDATPANNDFLKVNSCTPESNDLPCEDNNKNDAEKIEKPTDTEERTLSSERSMDEEDCTVEKVEADLSHSESKEEKPCTVDNIHDSISSRENASKERLKSEETEMLDVTSQPHSTNYLNKEAVSAETENEIVIPSAMQFESAGESVQDGMSREEEELESEKLDLEDSVSEALDTPIPCSKDEVTCIPFDTLITEKSELEKDSTSVNRSCSPSLVQNSPLETQQQDENLDESDCARRIEISAFQEVSTSAVKEVDNVSEKESDSSMETYKENDKNDNIPELADQDDRLTNPDNESVESLISSDVLSDDGNESSRSIEVLRQNEISEDSEEVKGKIIVGSFIKSSVPEINTKLDFTENFTVTSSESIEQCNKDALVPTVCSSDDACTRDTLTHESVKVHSGSEKSSFKDECPIYNVLPETVPDTNNFKPSKSDALECKEETSICNVAEIATLEDRSPCVDQDTNKDIIIGDKLLNPEDLPEVNEEKTSLAVGSSHDEDKHDMSIELCSSSDEINKLEAAPEKEGAEDINFEDVGEKSDDTTEPTVLECDKNIEPIENDSMDQCKDAAGHIEENALGNEQQVSVCNVTEDANDEQSGGVTEMITEKSKLNQVVASPVNVQESNKTKQSLVANYESSDTNDSSDVSDATPIELAESKNNSPINLDEATDSNEQNEAESIVESDTKEEEESIVESDTKDGAESIVESETKEEEEGIVESDTKEEEESIVESDTKDGAESIVESETKEEEEGIVESDTKEEEESIAESDTKDGAESIVESETKEEEEGIVESDTKDGAGSIVESETKEEEEGIVESDTKQEEKSIVEPDAKEGEAISDELHDMVIDNRQARINIEEEQGKEAEHKREEISKQEITEEQNNTILEADLSEKEIVNEKNISTFEGSVPMELRKTEVLPVAESDSVNRKNISPALTKVNNLTDETTREAENRSSVHVTEKITNAVSHQKDVSPTIDSANKIETHTETKEVIVFNDMKNEITCEDLKEKAIEEKLVASLDNEAKFLKSKEVEQATEEPPIMGSYNKLKEFAESGDKENKFNTHLHGESDLNTDVSGADTAVHPARNVMPLDKLDNISSCIDKSEIYKNNISSMPEDFKPMDNLQFVNFMSEKSDNVNIMDNHEKHHESLHVASKPIEAHPENTASNINDNSAVFNAQQVSSESMTVTNDFKKEANKRSRDVSDIQDVPPLKSKPPYVESSEPISEGLINSKIRLDLNSESSKPVEIATSEIKINENELSENTTDQLINSEPTTIANTSDNMANELERKHDAEEDERKEDSEIRSVDLKAASVTSDDSMEMDNDNVFATAADEEMDPLACTDDDTFKKLDDNEQSDISPHKIGLRVKPVSELLYDGWKLDSTESPKVSRKRRNSSHESNSDDMDAKQVGEEMMGGKRIKLRAKRMPERELRKSMEESRVVTVSSEDEAVKCSPEKSEDQDAKDISDDQSTAHSAAIERKARGRPRGRRRRGYRGSGRSTRPKHSEFPSIQASQVSPEVHLDETPSNNDSLTSTPMSQKKRKKRKMVLGLEIGRDIVPETASGLNQDETPVRQSRRIAQLKIKEEADRRRIEEETSNERKEKKDSTEKKKRKKQKPESEEEVIIKEIEKEKKSKKKRRKRKKKKMLAKFNEANPWQSSSGSSSDDENENDEEEDEEEEIESEGSLLFKSDHEFSPESDLEKDQESEPLRRARTAQKAQSDVEEADDEYACQKCGKADHPEWILLCDSCDKGWHCSCLRPALMLIPEGDWFCPPCQHNLLVNKLRESLKTYDQLTKRHENEVLRKKRLAFVGISLDNVLHKNESQRHQKGSKASSQESDNESSSASSSSSSETSSSEESEPVYQLRERRCANRYKFNDYDAMINAAIQDEVEAVQGAGNQGRGKDIATIVNAEKEEAQLHFKNEVLDMEETPENKDDIDRKSEKDSDDDYKVEGDDGLDDEEEEDKGVVKKFLSRKKHRKLNSLDISSEDDPESDEDFKGTSSEEDEDFDDHMTSSDESSFADMKRRRKKGDSRSVRRSTRARTTRYDEDFINDDSEESDRPKRKKSRSTWDSDNEDSDNSWRQKKKKSRTISASRYRAVPKTKSRKKKKRKRIIESDNQSENDDSNEEPRIEVPQQLENSEPALSDVMDIKLENNENKNINEINDMKLEEMKSEIPDIPVALPLEDITQQKKKKDNTFKAKKAIRRKIIYGGLPDENKPEEEEILSRRTRGRKINYQEEIASDSEEELKKALRRTGESEDEFVVNEGEDMNEDAEKDSDSGDIYNPKKDGHKLKNKSPKSKRPRKSKSPGGKRKILNDGMPKQRKKPGPKPGSKNKSRKQNCLLGSLIQRRDDQDGDKDIMANVMDNPIGEVDSKIDDNLSENVGLTSGAMSVAGSFTGDVPEGSLTGLGAGELAELDDEQLEQMMMEDEEYGRRQLELAAIEIAKKKKKEEREAKKLEKARLKALEILAAERQRDPNAPEGLDGEVPKKKKRGRRSKAEILAEQMRRDGTPNLNTTVLSASVPQSMSPNINPNMSAIMTPDAERTGEGHIPMMTGPDGQLFNPDGSPMKPKRRGRGKGKKTLALEAARAAEAAAKAAAEAGLIGMGADSNSEIKPGEIPNVLPTPGSSTSGSAPSTPPAGVVTTQGPPASQTPTSQSVYPSLPPNQQSSVITRMLQSQPVSSSPQSFSAAAAAMGHKYFGGPNTGGQMMGGPRTGYEMQPRGRIPSPYRQAGQSSMPPHFAAVRSGTPPMRMRVPGPQMYHTPHHPMDPSPSGGGPISINNRDRSSPLGPGPAMIPPAAGSPLAKGGPTPPPPPPYVRGAPPMSRFADNPMGPRHQMPPFTNASPVNHSMQQPSPPPNRPPGNFSPYHPPPPPNYHYGAYPPPPPMSTADDAAAYQGSPYPADHFSSPADSQPPPIQAPPPPQPPPQQQAHPNDAGAGNKQYDEEGSGEFGGLVSYFSSQREDDLDS